jgi:hypothetical protein
MKFREYLIYPVRKLNLMRQNFISLSTFDIPFLHHNLIRLKVHCFSLKTIKVIYATVLCVVRIRADRVAAPAGLELPTIFDPMEPTRAS